MPYTTVEGEKLFYSVNRGEFGRGLPPLVLVHGAGGTYLHWPPDLRHLPDAPAYALDLPGHGRSGGQARDTIEAYSDVVYGFVRSLGLPPVVIMGHSMGGAIAQDFALRHKDLLAGLALVGTGARLRVAGSILNGLREDYPATARMIGEWAHASYPSEKMLKLYVQRLLEVPAEVTYDDFVACNRFDLMEDVSRIDVPTLVVCGQEDRLTPPKYCSYLAANIPGAELVLVPAAGHMVMLEQPEEVTAAVERFLHSTFAGYQRDIGSAKRP